MRILLAICLFVVCHSSSFGYNGNDTLFRQLDDTIANAARYDAEKQQRISNLKRQQPTEKDLVASFNWHQQLYEEYKLFNFDSAFIYAKHLERLAVQMNDTNRIVAAKTKLAFILLSAGLFKEAYDFLGKIDVHHQPDSTKAAYFTALGRYYYDVADYNNDNFYSPNYVADGNRFMDSALYYYTPNSFERTYYTGLKYIKQDSLEKAYQSFHALIERPTLTHHQTALTTSTLSYIYQAKGDMATAIAYHAQAAMADIHSSTKETFATLSLAQLLFNEGDFTKAAIYIKKAIEDASFYGARQRKVQVSALLPIIQSSEMNYVQSQRKAWIVYGAIVSVAVLLLALLLITIYRQNKRLEHAKSVITQAHENLHSANAELRDLNAKLLEANKIKEEYIGNFFTNNSAFFHKIERFKNAIEKKVNERKLEDVRFLINTINLKDEKEELLQNFDKAFLKFFPHFVQEFNALFDAQDQINLPEGQLLNTDLRIYALIRLGIKENEKIAEILEYSIKSIYAYKTKIRNRARYPKEVFERKIMEIKSI